MTNLPEQLTESIGNTAFNNAIFEGYMAIFEGKGVVCRIIDGTRDNLVMNEHMPKELANAAVLKTRQLFFDPLATPGSKPVTDPEFKRYLPLFPYCAGMMVHRFKFGTDRYMREEAEDFAARFVEYMKEHYGDSLPQIRFTADFERLAKEIAGNLRPYRPDPDSYEVIPVASREELQQYVKKYRLDKWCIVHSDTDWDKFTMPGYGRFYMIVRDDADRTFDEFGVVGIVINHHGKVVYAFDRANHVVDKSSFQEIVDYHSLDRKAAQGFPAALEMLSSRPDMGVDEVFPYCRHLNGEYYVAGFPERGEYRVLAYGDSRQSYVSDTFGDISPLGGYPGVLVADDRVLYSLATESVIYRAPDGFTLRPGMPGFNATDTRLVPLYRGWKGGRPVNFVNLDDREKKMLLDPENREEIDDVAFHGRKPTVASMAAGEYWEVTAGGRTYAVSRPGTRLDGTAGIGVRESDGFTTLLSEDGYYSLTADTPSGKVSYLMKDGKKVYDRPFRHIDSTGDPEFDVDLETMDGKWYAFSTRTTQLKEYKD